MLAKRLHPHQAAGSPYKGKGPPPHTNRSLFLFACPTSNLQRFCTNHCKPSEDALSSKKTHMTPSPIGRLRYLASRRGTKELEITLMRLLNRVLAAPNPTLLADLETLLKQEDEDITAQLHTGTL